MVVTKPQKFARSVAENSKFKNGYRKSGSKKIFLKSAARNMIVMPNTQSNGSKKKVVCVKKRCLIQMKRKQRLPSHTAQDSKDRVSSWLKNQVAENLQDQSSEPVSTADSDIQGSNFKTKTPSKEETEINTIFQSLVPSKVTLQNSMENILKHNTVHNDDVMSHAEESALKSSAENIALQSENIGNGTMSSISFKNSAPTTLECGISNLVTGNPSTENQKKNKVRRISGRPLCAAKSLKARVKSGRQAFQRYYLKNSQGGFRLALKNFKRSKQCKAVNELPITKSVSDNSSKAPMKISLKKRRDPPPSCITPALTPDHDRSVSQFLVSPIGLPAKSVVSCKLPFDSSVDSGLSEDDRSSPEVLTKNQEQNQVREKRDVCYVFALLDREKSETVFKCSPHLKSSEILHQLASVIQTISMDDDVMISRNTCHKSSTNLDSPTTVKKYVERSTSPILCSDDCAQKTPTTDEADGAESSNDSEVPPSIAEFSPEDHLGSAKLCAEGCEKTTVTPAIKVMIVKSLMTLTSELKNPTDLSVRLLKWTSTALKGDIDNNMCKDSFEGFLCHCHDKISILLELCHMLDSKFIINLDEAELKNMWLLHDALCCMLQAYRYIQDLSSSPSSTLRQHLLSLMTTCAKTILPTEKVSVPVWISLMTMIQGINEKLCHKDVLSKACQCRHHFISLSINRFCRVCDLNCLYEDLCTGTEKGVQSATQKEKFDLMASPTTVVQQLFPRFSWFLCRIENISEEEFMTAYSKHLVMKFACNSQSGLLPCNEHLSEITCNCLSSLGSGSEAEVDEAALTVTESSNQEKSGVSLSHDSGFDNQRQSIFDVGTCITSESHDNDEVLSSDGSTGSIIPASAGSPNEVEKCESVPESQADSTSFVETLSLSGQSSDDYTLQLEASPADTTVDSINAKKSNNANPKKPELSEVHSSGNECSESDKVIEHESDDQHSKSPDIDYSPLNFQLAQSSLENAYSSFDSQTATCSRIPKCSISSHALADKCNQYFRSKSKMPVEEITLDSENSSDISGCMIDNSIAENAVFTHQDQGSETLRLCNKGPLSDSSSVEIEKKFQSKSSHDWNVSEGAHEGSSISLQSSASSDSLEVLSQNKALGSQPSSSMDRTMPLKRKYEDAAFNTKGKQKKLLSPPLFNINQSSESSTSGSYDPSTEFKEEIKSLKNCAVEVQPLMENKVHRTRSGRGFRAKQEMLPHDGISIGQSPGNYNSSNQNNSSKAAPNVEVKNSKRHPSSRKKGVSQAKEAEMEQKVENKVNHCGQTQKPVVKCSTHHQLYPSNSRNQSEPSFDRKQKISSKEIEQTAVNEDQSHPSPITNGVIEHQNLNCQDELVKEVDLLEQVGSSNRNRRVGKKLLSLSARMSKTEDVGPAQSIHNIQSRRSAKITTNPVQSQDAGNQVSTSAKSKQESLKICATEDSDLSRCSADETNGSYTSNTEDNSKINEERVSQSSFKVNVKDAKSSKFNDVKNDSAHSLISILKVGCATKNEQDFLHKREIPETQPDFPAKDNKKVRFSSPDNRYHLIEARKESKRSGRHCRQEKVTKNEADAETSSAPEHPYSKGVTVKTLAEPNYLVSSETKPVRKRQSQRIIKSNTQLVATEKDVALKERSRNEEALPKSREAANSETNNLTASEMISKNKLVSVSCSEIPIRNHKGKVKTNVSGQIPDSNTFEEHVEKLSKRKRPKNAVEEQFPPKEVIEKAPEVVERLQKLKKPKKEKNVVSTVTEKCQSNNYGNAWKNYIADLRERLQ